jgi:hypothetical protein
MVRILNYQHYFDLKFSTPMSQNKKKFAYSAEFFLKCLFWSYACTSGHQNNLLRYIPHFLQKS